MRAMPRWLAWISLLGSILVSLIALVVATTGVAWVGSVAAAIEDGAAVTVSSSEAVRQGMGALAQSLDAVSVGLRDVQQSLADASLTLTQAAAVSRDLADLLGDELPAGIEAIRSSVESLVDTARLVDRSMRVLAVVGVDYDPDVPLDLALIEVDQRLADIASLVGGRSVTIRAIADRIAGFGSEALDMSGSVAEIRRPLADAAGVVQGVEGATAEAAAALARLRSRARAVAPWARFSLVVGGLGVVAAQAFPFWLSLSSLRSDRPNERQAQSAAEHPPEPNHS